MKMHIQDSTRDYEEWLRSKLSVVEDDLTLKHERMARDPYTFLRGTFYHWMQTWYLLHERVSDVPIVLSVGDLHASNFGTWRDEQDHLVWGVNDFDEAYPLPYIFDLTRLAVSVRLAAALHSIKIRPDEACEAILDGYRDCLEAGGKPFILAEDNKWLKKVYLAGGKEKDDFWARMDGLPDQTGDLPSQAKDALEAAMPEVSLQFRLKHRQAGVGSLGRPRFTALATWRGKRIAREVKTLVLSAAAWARRDFPGAQIQYGEVLARAVRALDPVVEVRDNWVVRRLAPDSRRIELTELGPSRDEERMMYAMGWETGNIHLGTPRAISEILEDLKNRKKNWLDESSILLSRATWNDWKAWSGK